MLKFKILFLFVLLGGPLFAIEYASIVEPYQKYLLKSDTAGKIIYSNFELETSVISNVNPIIKIDSVKDKINLDFLKKRKINLNKTISLQEKNLNIVMQSNNKSFYEKSKEEQTLLNLNASLLEINKNILDLEDTISRKEITIPKGMYLNKVYTKVGDYVNPNTLLLDYYDISKSKIIVYVNQIDYHDILYKKVYINGKMSNFKINKISLKRDEDKISTFLIELINNSPSNFVFGDVVYVEFKN